MKVLLAALLVVFNASAADNIVVEKGRNGRAFLDANDGKRYPFFIGYQTNGSSVLRTLVSDQALAADDLIDNKKDGKAFLEAADGNRYPVAVLYTTDGNNNITPIAGGGGDPNTILNGGNTFGADATIGTNDTRRLIIETNGTEIARFGTSGGLAVANNLGQDPISLLTTFSNVSGNTGVLVQNNAASTSFASMTIRRARGTVASPSAALSGDFIGNFGTTSFGTSAWSAVTRIVSQAIENHTDASRGTLLAFYTTASGSATPVARYVVGAGGSLMQSSTGSFSSEQTSAAIDIQSTNKAVLLSRLTNTQRDALSPVNGMILYNTSTSQVEAYQGGSWGGFGGANTSLSNLVATSINQNLIPDSAGDQAVGSNTLPWGEVYSEDVWLGSDVLMTNAKALAWWGGPVSKIELAENSTNAALFIGSEDHALAAPTQEYVILGTGQNVGNGGGATTTTGELNVLTGDADGTANTGSLFLTTGQKTGASTSGTTGNVEIKTGNNSGSAGDSGQLSILTGNSTNGGSGNMYLTVGSASTTRGKIQASALGFQLTTVDAEPTCDSSLRGMFRVFQGGAGVADEVRACLKNAADAYVWTVL